MSTAVATDVGLMGHLMRRAGFGASTEQLEELAERGYDAVVDDLLDIGRHERFPEDLIARFHLEHSDGESAKWAVKRWIFRMINSPRPLEEKMTLMWHARFATGYSKVNNAPMMADYLEMLRDNCLGNFTTLLRELSRSPAMIWWLDEQTNHADAVNENYGRELLELFSMGRGNYTEDDVRACALAFTGWTIDQTLPRYPNGYYDTAFVYRADDHDDSVKRFLGEEGRFGGDDIIDIIVKQPATGRFVASNIYRWFVADEPNEEATEHLARAYFDSGYELREVMRALFHSDFFKEARLGRVKCPAEFVVGMMKLTGEHTDAYEFGLAGLVDASHAMGQELLNPPTVEGWHTGHEWIDSAYLIARVNFAAERLGNTEAPGVRRMIDRIAGDGAPIGANELVDRCLYSMGVVTIEERTRSALIEELGLEESIDCAGGVDDGEFADTATQVMQLIAASREFQMA